MLAREESPTISSEGATDPQEIFFLGAGKLSVSTVAQQFAALDSALFGKLELQEILFNSWQDPVKAPNFAAITEQSNGVGT